VAEGWLALGLLAALGALALAMAAPPELLLVAGFWTAALGLAFGVPTGFVYHVALRASLCEVGRLPPRWWLRPTALHGAIPDGARRRVLAWCYAGAAGFVVSLFGCVLLAFAAYRVSV
jgi:hypothetical protein